jgi:hypothetical protein
MRVRLRQLAGTALTWPGPDAEWADMAGDPVTLREGWQIVRWDNGAVTVASPGAVEEITEPEGA